MKERWVLLTDFISVGKSTHTCMHTVHTSAGQKSSVSCDFAPSLWFAIALLCTGQSCQSWQGNHLERTVGSQSLSLSSIFLCVVRCRWIVCWTASEEDAYILSVDTYVSCFLLPSMGIHQCQGHLECYDPPTTAVWSHISIRGVKG